MKPLLAAKLIIGLVLFLPAQSIVANATTGPGCLRVVNVAANDKLALRSGPSGLSKKVTAIAPNYLGVLHLDGACVPASKKWSSRWCPVTLYEDSKTYRGFVKARYVRDSECP